MSTDSAGEYQQIHRGVWLSDAPGILSAADNIMMGKPYSLGKMAASQLFMESWYFRGFDAALKQMSYVPLKDSSRYDFSPVELNNLDYFFLGEGQLAGAIRIFEFAVELHPNDYNLWDSLGEAHMSAGNKTEAIRNYSKALDLNPDCETAKSALQELENTKSSGNR